MDIIITHKNADFDAFASLFAAKLYYPDAKPVLPKTLNPNVRSFLSLHKDFFQYMEMDDIVKSEIKRIVMVDTNNWRRVDLPASVIKKKDIEIHIWDHHAGEIYPTPDMLEFRDVGATVTLFIQKFGKQSIKISPIEATLFLAGIYEDTDNLSFPSTTPEDAEAVALLLESGADLGILRNFLRPAYGPVQKDILFEMLKTPTRKKINGYSMSIARINIKGHVQSLAVVVDMFGEILNVDIAFGLFQERAPKKCIVIGRSRVEDFDISAIMKQMGGGGHPNAGSALIKGMEAEEVENWIIKLIRKTQRPMVRIADLMSYPVISVSPNTKMKDIAMIFREKGFTGMPVVRDGKVVGIISRRDFKRIRRDSQLDASAKSFMSTKIYSIGPDESVYSAVKIMIKHDIGRLPVVEKDRLVGIITRSDTMRYFYDLMPN